MREGLSNNVRRRDHLGSDRARSLRRHCDLYHRNNGAARTTSRSVAQVRGGKLLSDDHRPGETIPQTSNAERWVAENIPRDPGLPYDDDVLLDEEEETIPPTAPSTTTPATSLSVSNWSNISSGQRLSPS